MSQNPYSNIGSSGTQYGGGPGVGGDFIDPAPSRTSVLAIVALVVSIVGCIACVVPGPGALAAVLGGLAVFLIARSSGRVTGMGIAVTAIVLGLFQSVAIIALLIGASQANSTMGKEFFVPMGQMMTSIESGDNVGARAMLSPTANAAVTDEMLADFVKTYHANTGTFQKMPESVVETVTMFMEMSKSGQNGRNGTFGRNSGEPTFPLPAKFSQGSAILLITMDPTAMGKNSPGGSKKPTLLNVGVITLDGKEAWLIDPDTAHKLINKQYNGIPSGGSSSSGGSFPTSTAGDAPKDSAPKNGDAPPKDAPKSEP